jgi:probable selenium-dependent hydroxylase accessory protein YqeC
MTTLLFQRIGLGPRELVSIVGAGGKTTILQVLGRELASTGAGVILTTTTKMATNQITGPVCWSGDPFRIEESLHPGTPLFVLRESIPGKVTGFRPEAIDHLFTSSCADHIIVEADGARSMLIKAPADNEPVIPTASTTIIVVVGADALGQPLGTVAHRVDRIATLTGLTKDDVLTPERAATVLLHPNGGLKSIPDAARVVMAIANVAATNEAAATRLAEILADHPSVDRYVLLRPL